jgi:hypothetical protein
VMNERTAAYLSALRGSGGGPCFPRMTCRGGELLGLPALTSLSVARVGSPQETTITLLDPGRIWLTDEGRAAVSVSDKTNLEMSDVPSGDSMAPTAASMVSMFQTESIGIKATRWLNWRPVSAASAAATLTRVAY